MSGNAIIGAIGALLAYGVIYAMFETSGRLLGTLPFFIPYTFSFTVGCGIICGSLFIWNVYRSRSSWNEQVIDASLRVTSCVVIFGIVYWLCAFILRILHWPWSRAFVLLPIAFGVAAGVSTSIRYKTSENTIYSTLPTVVIIALITYCFPYQTPLIGVGPTVVPWGVVGADSIFGQAAFNMLFGAAVGIAASIKLKVKAEA